ncbi:MAG: DUF1064 domain-containing protein [Gammaproteobacteria bacterium]|nr:DUF1064 domain-containing protein [Gammaproteobacteria bacterium]
MPEPHKPTELVRWTADEFRKYIATGQLTPTRGTAHPQGTRCEEDGISFDSLTERDFYRHLKGTHAYAATIHIDAHPIFTLTGGIRYAADFMVTAAWVSDGVECKRSSVYDVKGRKPGTDFWRLKKLFDACHPLAPLRVVRRDGKGWREVETAKEWK